MKKAAIILFFGLALPALGHAQDFFSDRNGTATPIILNSGGKSTSLFTATVDVSDKSNLKANFYQQYLTGTHSGSDSHGLYKNSDFFGWGLSVKASSQDGLSNLFGSGDLNPGFTGGAYLAYTHFAWKQKDAQAPKRFTDWALILSSSLSVAHYQFYDPAQTFASQLSSNTYHGPSLSLSYLRETYPGKENIYYGFSFTVAKKDNYSDLNTVTIKNDSLTTGRNITRTVTPVNANGDVYATGKYQQYTNYNLRANGTWIPSALGYNLALTVYPSVDLSTAYHPKYNMGLAFSFLKAQDPSTTTASLFFELDDMNNAAQVDKPFLKRSFKVGVSTSLNIFSGNK